MEAFRNWWRQPFNDTMSVSGWALWVGMVIVLVILWNFVLRHVFEKIAQEL